VNEELYKYITIAFLLINISLFSKSINPESYSYVFNNFVPIQLSKNNVGISIAYINKKIDKIFVSTNWLTDNLYLGSTINSAQSININYSFNFGYKMNSFGNIITIYDISYHAYRFDNQNSKWKKLSLIFNIKDVLAISYNYIFADCNNNDIQNEIVGCENTSDSKNSTFINFNLFQLINKSFLINLGFKKSDLIIYPYLNIRFNI